MEKEFNFNEYCKKIEKYKKKLNKEYRSFEAEDVLSRIYFNEKTNKLEFCNVYQNNNGEFVACDRFYLKDNKIFVSLDEKISDDDKKFFMIPSAAIKGIGSNDQAWAWLVLGERKDEKVVEAYIKIILDTIDNQEVAENIKDYLIKKDVSSKHYREYDDKISEKYKELQELQKIEEKITDEMIKLQRKRNSIETPQFKRIELSSKSDENKKKLDNLEFEMERRL